MSIARGRFGIEYFPHHESEDSRGAGWIVFAVAFAAAGLLVSAGVRRILATPDEPPPAQTAESAAAPDEPPREGPHSEGARAAAAPAQAAARIETEAAALPQGSERNRPHAARILLLRLEKATEANDVELAVSTIEQLRALPGEAVADLDNKLARQLGNLNVKRLFVARNRQWVRQAEVRPGDSATRIARESGSTLASLLRLNSLPSADRLRVGQRLYVMDHPKFTFVVHRAARYADLSLKGKFFRRYDLTAPVGAPEGNYETPARLRAFLSEKGISLSPEDRSELETLLPEGTPVLVSEK
jgi:hypothetical protein